MRPKDRIVLLQRQLSVAMRALKEIGFNDASRAVANDALEEIERIKIVQEGRP